MKQWLRQQWLYIFVPCLLWGLAFATGLVGNHPDITQTSPSQIISTEAFQGEAEADGTDYISAAGLHYGADPSPEFVSRIDHVMAHTRPDPDKPNHSIFIEKNPVLVLKLIDEAWIKRGDPHHQGGQQGRDVYTVAMQRPIGEQGERAIRIIVESGTADIVTAYPYHEGSDGK